MDSLIRNGFTIEEIHSMMNTNPFIESVPDHDIYELIDILKKIGCNDNVIKNIFICNPFYLTHSVNEVNNLIKKMYELGFSYLYLWFDSNPYLFNVKDYELDRFFTMRHQDGFSKEEIMNEIFSGIII